MLSVAKNARQRSSAATARPRWLTGMLFLSLGLIGAAQAAIPAAERQALLNLYAQADGANWLHDGGWNGAVGTECNWERVTCNLSGTRVTGLDLEDNQLLGTLPPSLSDLSALTSLRLNNNQLSGNLPPLSGLTQLATLNLSNNQFSGAIPSLAGLANLQTLFLNNNQLTGSIPSLSGLVQLTSLNLSSNELTGSIPFLSGSPLLRDVLLSNNQFSGTVPILADLPQLNRLHLSNNQLNGSIPSIFGLSQLEVLLLDDNQLTGSIPSLASLTQLQYLHLNGNQLSGAIPSLSGLSQLVGIRLQDNQLTGPIPNLTEQIALTSFNVRNNELTGNAPLLPMPSPLLAGQSALCPNALNSSTGSANDLAWDAASGSMPWSQLCTPLGFGFSVSNSSVFEGNAGTSLMTFSISLTGVQATPVSVTWATVDISATASSGDYASGTATAAWNAGDNTPRMVTVFVNGDTTVEPNETFMLLLSNPVGAPIADGAGIGTILDDDTVVGSAPSITSGVPPGGTVGVPYSFTVTASGSPAPTFSAIGLPAGLSINNANGIVSGTPTVAGTGPVIIAASNDVLPAATQSFEMTIVGSPPNPMPVRIPALDLFSVIALTGLLGILVWIGLGARN